MRCHQHPFVLSPQLQCAWLHYSGWNPIQVEQLKAELPLASSNVKNTTPFLQLLLSKSVYQKPKELLVLAQVLFHGTCSSSMLQVSKKVCELSCRHIAKHRADMTDSASGASREIRNGQHDTKDQSDGACATCLRKTPARNAFLTRFLLPTPLLLIRCA